MIDTKGRDIESYGGKSKGSKGITITFRDLDYTVATTKKDTIKILSGLSGSFVPGRFHALMGPSGSGKTTLMDLLSGRKTAGQIRGEVLFDGRQPAPVVYKKLTSYVEQFDTLVPDLTVHQFLMYTATLKLPASTSEEEREERVYSVMESLNLLSCKDTIIGNELTKGISGGQKKRTNIAMALLTSPRILFLDEPTTGLDSHMANEVVLLCRKLAKQGLTVVATIHSPTAFAFNQFQDLTLLAQGKMIYHGSLGVHAKRMVSYFNKLGFAPKPSDSVVEWMVELISGRLLDLDNTHELKEHLNEEHDGKNHKSINDKRGSTTSLGDNTSTVELVEKKLVPNEEQQSGQTGQIAAAALGYDFAEAYSSSIDAKDTRALLNTLVDKLKTGPDTFDRKERTVSNSVFHGVKTIFRYRTLAHYSNGEFIGPRLGDKILFGLLILSLYFNTGDRKDIQTMQSVAGMLYFVVAILGYGAAAFTPSLSLDKPLFYRERSDGLYTTTTYFVAKFLEEAFVAIFTSLLFSIIVFFSVNLKGSFGVFFFVYFVLAMNGIVLAYFIASAIPTLEAANALLPTFVTINMFFAGFVFVFDKIPTGWQWFTWLNFLRYPWVALMLNQFDNDDFNDVRVFNGQTILEFYDMESGFNSSIWLNILISACFLVFYSICALLALKFIRHDSR
uniref:ABC transporter domain-containing protein n=1 Tax=Amorphochlora amoebiformis TaxID=1561963 RepID=A0A7S0DUP1_9EUKA|mmetsp:Transcript_9907/g.15646  ORF Transcript_9907/g.15646 Transcript_9907/m.15646 type:complete len:674 (+) Transcript_9907:84-2105(+)